MGATVIQDISLSLPKKDMKLLKDIAKRLGWSIHESPHKTEYEIAMEEVDKGEITTYTSVDAYFKSILE